MTLDEGAAGQGPWGGVFALVTVWGLGGTLAAALQASWLAWPLFAFGLLIILGVLSNTRVGEPVVGAAIGRWVVAGLALLALDPEIAGLTHGAPLGVAMLVGLARRSLRLADARDVALTLAGFGRSAPFVVPVVLIFLFLPALNADVWELASSLNGANLVGSGVLSVGTLFLIVRLRLGRELGRVLATHTAKLITRTDLKVATRTVLLQETKGTRARVVRELPDAPFDEAWSERRHEEYVPYVISAEGGTLRRPLTGRLLVTIALAGAVLSIYTYALVTTAVPRSVAERWTGQEIRVSELDAWLLSVSLPGSEYLIVAILFGIAATAVFLAFVLTEERYTEAVPGALLREPVEAFLLLALPYVALTDKVLSEAQEAELRGVSSPSADSEGNGVDNNGNHDSRSS